MGTKGKLVKFYSTVSDRSEVIHMIAELFNKDGGPGSGNFGHEGRPGLVGGSGEGGGSQRPEKQEKTLQMISRKIRNLKKEQFFLITEDGEVPVSTIGKNNQVAIRIGDLREHGTGAITIHNHPKGGTFSADDLDGFGYGEKEMIVVGPDGTYSLKNLKWDTKERYNYWIPMRDALMSEVPQEMDYGDLKKVAEDDPEVKEIDGRMNTIATKWLEMKDNGASRDDLEKFMDESGYHELSEKRREAFRKAVRIAEVNPQHEWFKANAEKFGYEYTFTPATKKANDGGPGSGNFGHKGRPGKVGGSGPGGGKQYRGGRADIGYFNSRNDWLNGLSGERQHEASQIMKKISESIPATMYPEEYIMKKWPLEARESFLGLVGEARSWKDRGFRLATENLDQDEQFALVSVMNHLINKYDPHGEKEFITEEEWMNNNLDRVFGLMTDEEKQFYLDMKAKACGLPVETKPLDEYSKAFMVETGAMPKAEVPLTDEDNKDWIQFMTKQEKDDLRRTVINKFGVQFEDFAGNTDMNRIEQEMVNKMMDKADENEANDIIYSMYSYLRTKEKALGTDYIKGLAELPPYYSGGDNGLNRLNRYESYALKNVLETAKLNKEDSFEKLGDIFETSFIMDQSIPQKAKANYLALKSVALGMSPEGLSTFGMRRNLERYIAEYEDNKRREVIAKKKAEARRQFNESKKQYDVVVKGDSFSEKINSFRTETGEYSIKQYREIGTHMADELENAMLSAKERKAEVSKKLEEIKKKIEKEKQDLPPHNWDLAERGDQIRRIEEKYLKEQQELRHELYKIDHEKPLVDVLKRIRQVGPENPDSMIEHLPGRSTVKQPIMDAYNYYPRAWVEKSLKSGSMITKKTGRGYYTVGGEMAISGDWNDEKLETAVHELGHRFEDVIPGIVDTEREFYNSRTENEESVKLSKLTGIRYGADEVAKKDHFIEPYIGKDYGGRDVFEIVSMGFQYAFTDPSKLFKDKEYAQLILGMLAVG